MAADGFKHPADLAIAAFGEGDLDEALGAIADAPHVRGARGAVGERDALAELLQLFVAEDGGRFHQVGLRHVERGVGEAFGQLRVVGHQQQAGGIQVQPADGSNEGAEILQQIVDGGAAFGIVERRQVAFGLVEQEVDGVGLLQRTAVKGDLVAGEVNPLIGILGGAAVDGDASGMDPGAGLRAGAEAGLGDHAFQSFLRQLDMLAHLWRAGDWEWRGLSGTGPVARPMPHGGANREPKDAR